MRKITILVFIFSFLIIYLYADNSNEYTKLPMSEILEYANRIATEHLTDQDLKEVSKHHTYFKEAKYISYYKWNETDQFVRTDDEAFQEIEYSMLMLGRPKEILINYKNYIAFNYNDSTIIFVYSDYLKNDFIEWVNVGDVIEFFIELASYEAKSKTIIFIVNKYNV